MILFVHMLKLSTFFTLLSFPVLTLAAGIVPCNPKIENGVLVDQCGFCEVGKLVKSSFDWFVLLAGIFVVIAIMLAGIWMVVSVGNVSAKNGARKIISSALIGYAMLLGAWMIVDTFLKFLVPGSDYGAWNSLMCS